MLPIFLMTKKCYDFQKKICTLADNLLAHLPPPSLICLAFSYEKILKYPNSKFKFNFVSEETVLKTPSGFGWK